MTKGFPCNYVLVFAGGAAAAVSRAMTPAVVDLEDEETTAASRSPARRLAAMSTSRAATPAKRRLGLGGPRLGPVQAQSPSKRFI